MYKDRRHFVDGITYAEANTARSGYCKSWCSKALFTLVELLVVIGIMMVLAAMLMPSLNRVLASAKLLSCSNNLKQIGSQFAIYADTNNGWGPVVDSNQYCSLLAGNAFSEVFGPPYKTIDQSAITGLYLCPSAALVSGASTYRTSYAFTNGNDNSPGKNGGYFYSDTTAGPSVRRYRRISDLLSNSVLMVEKKVYYAWGTMAAVLGNTNPTNTNRWPQDYGGTYEAYAAGFLNHNNSNANFLYADGHIVAHAVGVQFTTTNPIWIPAR